MKRLGITQRVEVVASYGERRDCLDQRWATLAQALGFVPAPLPNVAPTVVPALFDALQLDALILSGGNSLAALDPEAADAAPERDAFEAAVIDEAMRRGVPVVGVCRGMQMVNVHLGGALCRVTGHVATRHALTVAPAFEGLIAPTVNSFHGYAIPRDGLAPTLEPMARDEDDHIECFVHTSERVAGVMWHPEREDPLRAEDVDLFGRLLT